MQRLANKRKLRLLKITAAYTSWYTLVTNYNWNAENHIKHTKREKRIYYITQIIYTLLASLLLFGSLPLLVSE